MIISHCGIWLQAVLKFAFENLNYRILEPRMGNAAISREILLILLEWAMLRLPKCELANRVVQVLELADGNGCFIL